MKNEILQEMDRIFNTNTDNSFCEEMDLLSYDMVKKYHSNLKENWDFFRICDQYIRLCDLFNKLKKELENEK